MSKAAAAMCAMLVGSLPMAAVAKAGKWDGQDFMRYCVTTSADAIKPTDRDENDHVIYCDGYLEGAVTAVFMLENDLICAPRNARPVDVVRLVVDRLQRHPEDKRELLAMVIWNAALDNWHCK